MEWVAKALQLKIKRIAMHVIAMVGDIAEKEDFFNIA
jgi:hypothetical protein